VMVLMMAAGVAAQTPDTTWYTSNPTAASFEISNADQLAGLAMLVNGMTTSIPPRQPVNFSGKTITLTADIDLSQRYGRSYNGGKGWIPVGAGNGSFNGVFDGNGKTVSGLYINGGNNGIGFFGMTGNTKIIGLTLVADSIKATNNAGILIGRANGSTTIEDCRISGYVSSDNHVGGLIGYGGGTINIKNCHTSGYFISGSGRAGGLVGYGYDSPSSIAITGSSANGSVIGPSGVVASEVGGLIGMSGSVNISESYSTCNVSGGSHAGGLVGYGTGGIITGSFSTGNITGGGDAGGLIGNFGSVNISKCYSTGDVVGGGSVGGFIGFGSNGGTIQYCYSTGNVNGGKDHSGGFAGMASTITNCYSTGNVNGGSGFAGFASTITNCYSTGRVSGGHGFASGINRTVSRCFWDVETSNYQQTTKDTAAYAAGKTTAAMKQKATFTNWNFETVWMINEGNDYPRLRGVGGPYAVFSLVYRAGANGSILGSASQTVQRDSSGETVVAVPAAGYSFVMWSDGLRTAARTDADVTSNIDVTAVFAPEGARVLLYVAGDGGAIVGSAMQIVAPGESGTPVEAAPSAGYVFVSWSDGSKNAARADANITSDAVYTAVFAKIHSLSYVAGANGTILGSREQSVIAGSSGTMVMAVANTGYRFESWSDGVTTAERTDVNVSEDISVTAIFDEWKYVLSYSANAEYGRILISGGTVQEFTERVDPGADGPQVMAVGNAGYTFHHWSDGVTTALRQDVDVQMDIIVTAYFADADGNISVASNDRVIPPKNNAEIAVVAPVSVLTGEFVVGPNPVGKSSGSVAFFWQGKQIKSGALTVYDASGNVVRKLAVKDNAAISNPAKRVVGSWDLKDAKGRQVSEGTYLVRGKFGGKVERAAVVVGVR